MNRKQDIVVRGYSDPTNDLGSNPKFGRLKRLTDIRDHEYLAKHQLPKRSPGVTYKNHTIAPIMDQGNTSQCVAYSSIQFLKTGPVKNIVDPKELSTDILYKLCQENDEWPGEDYDGTSVRAAMRMLKRIGYISEYRWAFDVQTCAQWVLTRGPMVFGTIWTAGMMRTDSKGFIHVDGPEVGGHAYVIRGVNLATKCPDGSLGRFDIANSWGLRWGRKGLAYLSFKDAEILLKEYGEAACATEVKRVPGTPWTEPNFND